MANRKTGITLAVAALAVVALVVSFVRPNLAKVKDLFAAQQQPAAEPSAQEQPEEEPAEEQVVMPSEEQVAEQKQTLSEHFTWAVVGDSLTEKNFRAATSYYDYVSDMCDCSVLNYGYSGTGYMEAGSNVPFHEIVQWLDLEDTDIVTIFGSFNDLGKGYPLGTAYDEGTDTIGGCMASTVEYLRKESPSLRIGIVTPIRWQTGFAYDADGNPNPQGTTREECDAYVQMLKQVAGRYGVLVLDLYSLYPLDPDDPETLSHYYVEDGVADEYGVHPNSEGHQLMYRYWRDFLAGAMK